MADSLLAADPTSLLITPFFKTVSETGCLKDSKQRQKDWCLEDVLQAQSLLLVLV